MVSHNSPPNSNQVHFQNQHFNPYMRENPHDIHPLGEELNLFGTTPNETHEYRQRPMSSNFITPTYFTQEATSFAIGVAYSKYLEPAQRLLEEMVTIEKEELNSSNEKLVRRMLPNNRKGSMRICSEIRAEISNGGVSGDNHQAQVRIMKLISLLEEVEKRYEQYYHHLEESVSSFEMIAGLGAGKSYTALALQAMSRHFCTLRDSITSQILIARQRNNHELNKPDSGLSQLGLIDKENRQNCRISLQQIGILQTQKQAWRPIRGLPETSVMILRSWLFEHFLHPYPNDSEKLMLSSQTGLTKNQVSNWFINARVRLWKPMIEEMYKDEFAESSAESDPLLATNSEE